MELRVNHQRPALANSADGPVLKRHTIRGQAFGTPQGGYCLIDEDGERVGIRAERHIALHQEWNPLFADEFVTVSFGKAADVRDKSRCQQHIANENRESCREIVDAFGPANVLRCKGIDESIRKV